MGFFDKMKQLNELKQKMEETKARLKQTEVSAENDYVKVIADGNREIKNITILNMEDKAILAGKLQSAINEALQKSDSVFQREMLAVTKGMMPDGLPSLEN